MHPQAKTINSVLEHHAPELLDFFGQRGREIFFPHGGILGQTAQAKGARLNATIGIALEDDASPMRLACMDEEINFRPQEVYPYASSFGQKDLRELWRRKIYEKNPSLQSTISVPVVTAGLTHGLSLCGYLFTDPGDSLHLTDLYWGNYGLIFEKQFGLTLKPFHTFAQERFDTESFTKALEEDTSPKKVVLLNFPNNPSGYTPTEKEAQEIIDVILKRAEAGDKLVILIDDAYFGLVYEEGILRESLFAALSDLHENVLAVKIDGATKEDYAWGFRVGFLTYGHPKLDSSLAVILEDKTAGAVRATVSNCTHFSQTLLLQTYLSPDYERQKKEKAELMQRRYTAVKEALRESKYEKYFQALPFNSGYFMCLELHGDLDTEEVRKRLLEDYDTGVIACNSVMRIAYSSLPTPLIPELFENLYSVCKKLARNAKSYSLPPHSHEPCVVS